MRVERTITVLTAFLALCALTFTNISSAKDIIFGTPPTQTVANTVKLYQPLVDYLNKESGAHIKLEPARNFLEFTNNMRKGVYDMIFDGPHFASWRMVKIGHRPIARLPGKLVFMVAVKENSGITKPKELIGKKICGLASPNLATLMVLDYFPNPVRQPLVVPVRSFKASLACLKKDSADGAIIPIKFWKKFTKKGLTKGLKLLLSTTDQPLPHRTFTISNRIDKATQDRITRALLNSEGKPGPKALLAKYRSKNFIAAPPELYSDLDRLLSSVWGFSD